MITRARFGVLAKPGSALKGAYFMNTNTSIDLSEDYGTSPDAAVQLEKEARQEDDIGT